MTNERARELLATVSGVLGVEGTSPIVARIAVEQFELVARFAKETLGFEFFNFSTAIDWKDDGLEVVAWVDNIDANVSLQLRTKLGAGNVACPSLVRVYRGANWMERDRTLTSRLRDDSGQHLCLS